MRLFQMIGTLCCAALAIVGLPSSVAAQDDANMSAIFRQAMDDSIAQDDYEARERAKIGFAKVCATGLAKACYNAGVLSELSYDSEATLRWMTKACDGGKRIACYYVADKMVYGDNTDLPGARALFGRSCAQGVTAACLRFATMLESEDGGPEDPRKAFDVLKRACAAPSGVACERLASFYSYRDGFTADDSIVRSTLETACGLKTWSACASLAQMLRQGRGGPVEEPRATELLFNVCLHGENMSACDSMLLALDK